MENNLTFLAVCIVVLGVPIIAVHISKILHPDEEDINE